MTHIMIDIETWGTEPGCDIRSIGACYFDVDTGYIPNSDLNPHTFYTATTGDYGLFRDPATVKWWSEQSEEAQTAFDFPIDLSLSLSKLDDWLSGFGEDYNLWSHGASFDPVILHAAYKAVGKSTPWRHWQLRDTRTIYDIAKVELNDFRQGTYHNALHDAISQARAVNVAYAVLDF